MLTSTSGCRAGPRRGAHFNTLEIAAGEQGRVEIVDLVCIVGLALGKLDEARGELRIHDVLLKLDRTEAIAFTGGIVDTDICGELLRMHVDHAAHEPPVEVAATAGQTGQRYLVGIVCALIEAIADRKVRLGTLAGQDPVVCARDRISQPSGCGS